MKIVIATIGKTGSTALAYKIAAALDDCGVVFEPVQRRPLLESGRNTVAKISLRGTALQRGYRIARRMLKGALRY